MSWIKDFLDWLYTQVGLDVSVFDEMYEAAKGSDSDTAKAVREWYKDNLGDE